MKLSELKRIVDLNSENRLEHEDPEVTILIELPYTTVGCRPMVKVKGVYNGFDWEQGRFYFVPEEPLTPKDRDFATKMKDWQDKVGWVEYENRGLKAENKRLKKLLKVEE